MLTGLSGSLVTRYFAERLLSQEFAGRLGDAMLTTAERTFARWWQTQASQLGPASSSRSIWDVAAAPLVELLGFAAHAPGVDDAGFRFAPLFPFDSGVVLIAATADVSLDNLWRDVARRGIALDARWVLCTNARDLRLVDTQRTYSRAYLQFDLARTAHHLPTFTVLVGASARRSVPMRSGPGSSPPRNHLRFGAARTSCRALATCRCHRGSPTPPGRAEPMRTSRPAAAL